MKIPRCPFLIVKPSRSASVVADTTSPWPPPIDNRIQRPILTLQEDIRFQGEVLVIRTRRHEDGVPFCGGVDAGLDRRMIPRNVDRGGEGGAGIKDENKKTSKIGDESCSH